MQSRLLSIILSLCLHAGVIAVALFWPASAPLPVDLTAPVIDIDIFTIGRPGTAPVKVPAAPSAPPQAPAKPAAPPPPAPETPVAPPQAPETPVPPPAKPEARPVPIPEKPEEAPKPEPSKPEPPKPEPPKPAPSKPQPQKPREKPEDVLRRALGDLDSQRESGDALARALGDMRSAQNAQGNEEADGPGGSGGDGIGVVGSYMQSLVSRIKPNWEYAGRADRRNPTAVAEIRIAGDGTILEALIVTSSGDNAFDGSVLKAIRDTVRVEPPPSPDLARVRVPFAYQALR